MPVQSSMRKIKEEDLNKIYCIDCMEGFKKIPDRSVDLLLTDPPYGISRELNCKGQRLGTTAKLNFDFGEWDKLNHHWIEEALRKIKGWVIIFCAKITPLTFFKFFIVESE